MEYPKTFVDACLKLFPTWEDLKVAIENGSPNVGKYLCDACLFAVDEDMVISAFRNKKEHKILEMAKRTKKIRNLYQEWYKIMDKHESDMAHENGYEDCVF